MDYETLELDVIKLKDILLEDYTIALARAYHVAMDQKDYDELGRKIDRNKFKRYFHIPRDADEDPNYKRDPKFNIKKLTQLKEIIRKELLKEDDYATQYVDMIDDITKEVNRKSSKIVKLLNKQDKITGTKNARVYNQAVDKHFRNFIVAIMKITAKIED